MARLNEPTDDDTAGNTPAEVDPPRCPCCGGELTADFYCTSTTCPDNGSHL